MRILKSLCMFTLVLELDGSTNHVRTLQICVFATNVLIKSAIPISIHTFAPISMLPSI